MRIQATEMQIDGSITPDEYYFSFAGDPHEVAEAVEEFVVRAKQFVMEHARSSSNTPQDLSNRNKVRQHPRNASNSSRISYPRSPSPRSSEDGDTPSEGALRHAEHESHPTLLESYTYPPGTSELPQPSILSDMHQHAWSTWIRKQPRRVLGVPAKLPFAGRLPFTYWGHLGKKEASDYPAEGRDFSSEDEVEITTEMDLLSKEKEFLKSTFGLGEREEVVYRKFGP